MQYVLEFGVRGGQHVDNVKLSSAKVARTLAASLVRVFLDSLESASASQEYWRMDANCVRKTWQSSSHFVALSKLDQMSRGSASATLWRKE